MPYEIEVNFSITKDGQPFHATKLRYDNLDYEDVVNMEKLGSQSIGLLTQFGESKLKDKKEKGKVGK